jgi:hypothetical protein
MRNIKEIQNAITRLSAEDLARFRNWFDEFDSALFDAKIERDIWNGKLDAIAENALRNREGKLRDL